VATPAGLALGRWACFCRGCCYGRVTDVWWALSFPKHIDISGQIVGSPPFLRHLDQALINASESHSLSVHPSQIYSSLLSVAVFIVMLWFWKTGYAKGRLVFVYLILYALARFIVEFTRDNQMAFSGLTIAQVFSIVIGLGAACGLVLCHFRKSKLRA
jgi:phosphatidylglycerol:prolipoprotein diacylglycerol transferase